MFLRFDRRMSVGKDAGSETIDWYVEPDRPAPDVSGIKFRRARRDEQHANSLGLIITTSLFFVLFATAVMIGGHAAIAPLLRHAVAVRDGNGVGDIVYTMPDGVFCRHMSFDNATGEVTEGGLQRCAEHFEGGRAAASTGFKWGAH